MYTSVYKGSSVQQACGALPDPVSRAVIIPFDGICNPRSVDRVEMSTRKPRQEMRANPELVDGYHKPVWWSRLT